MPSSEGASLFLDSGGGNLSSHSGRGQSNHPQQQEHRQFPPPGFSSSDFLSSSAGTSSGGRHEPTFSGSRHFVDRSGTQAALDRQAIGDNLVRSHSAAPSFDGRLSVGLPPGLASRATPLVSNRSSSTTSRDSFHDHFAVDRSHILQLGQRRPASTGVIGDNQSSSSAVLHSLGLGSGSGAVRPAAKTLMDLIQEDFPPESSIDAGDFYGSDFAREAAYLERPRTTSPMSSQNMMRDQYLYGRVDDANGLDPSLNGGMLSSFSQIRPGFGGSYPNSRNSSSNVAVSFGSSQSLTDVPVRWRRCESKLLLLLQPACVLIRIVDFCCSPSGTGPTHSSICSTARGRPRPSARFHLCSSRFTSPAEQTSSSSSRTTGTF